MTPKETQMMLANLLSMYPNHTLNDFATDQWCKSMASVPADAAYAEMQVWIDTEKWFPTVAEFKERLAQSMTGLPTPGEAWLMVLQRMKSTYPGRPAEKWDAPREVQDALEDIGGMHLLRHIDRADDARKRFDKAYTERVDRSRRTTPELGANAMKELLG